MAEDKRVLKEVQRLKNLYKDLSKDKQAIAQGLIVQAARMRIRCDDLWKNLQEHGETEMFTQSEKTDPYERERPQARLFTASDKAYQSVIKQLNDMLPDTAVKPAADDLMAEFLRG